MKRFKLKIGLDADDVLYECNAYALRLLNEGKYADNPIEIEEVTSWGLSGTRADERVPYFSDPEFVSSQPLFNGAKAFVRKLSGMADVFFVTSVAPNCVEAREKRLREDFPDVPEENYIFTSRKDVVALDIVLDDGAHNIESSSASYPVLFRRPWNENLSGLMAINSYSDFIHLVEMIAHSYTSGGRFNLSKGGVVCLVGPSGSKKTEVARALTKIEGFIRPKTLTTRPKESKAPHYKFISKEKFIEMRDSSEFFETTVYNEQHYGILHADIDEVVSSGNVAVLPVDICGAIAIKAHYKSKAIMFFMRRDKEAMLCDIIARRSETNDTVKRIISLDYEAKNEDICDVAIDCNRTVDEICTDILTKTKRIER